MEQSTAAPRPSSVVPFGVWLRRTREAAGLSQKDLAGLAGIAGPNLSLYEHGKMIPGFEVCVALATELGTDKVELICRSVKERLLKGPDGQIFLAEARDGRFYDDEAYEV